MTAYPLRAYGMLSMEWDDPIRCVLCATETHAQPQSSAATAAYRTLPASTAHGLAQLDTGFEC